MANLQYDMSVIGLRSVDAAFAHVEARAKRSNRVIAQGSSGRTARAAAMSEEQVRAEVARRGAALRERLAKRTADRIARLEVAAAAKSEAEKTALAKRADAARAQHASRMARIEAASKLRMEAASAKSVALVASQERRRAMRADEAEARAKLAASRRANAAAAASVTGGRRKMAGVVGSAALGSVSSIGRSALSGAMIGGTALLGSAIYTQGQESLRATQLANQAGTPGRKGEILSSSQKIQGFTGMEALEGLGAWTDVTGDLKTGEAILNELAATALATGTSLEDMASAAAVAFIPLNDSIPDADEKMKALKDTIRSMAGMGAVGAVEIKDLASQMAGLAANATLYGDAQTGIRIAVATAQAARQRGGASSAAEAVTSVERFGSDTMSKAALIKQKTGVDVWRRNKQGVRVGLKDQRGLMADIITGAKGDVGTLKGIYGEYGIRAVKGFAPLYNEAEARQKGSGRAAVMAEFDRLEKSTLSDEAVNERTASLMEEPAMQLKESFKELNSSLGSEFIPIVNDLIKALKDATPQIVAIGKAAADIAKWVIDNPYQGIGLIIAGKVTADIAQAAIGQAVSTAITGQIAASMGVPGAGGAGGTMAAGAGLAGGLAFAAAIGAALGAFSEYGKLYDTVKSKDGKGTNPNDLSFGSVANFLLLGGAVGAAASLAGGDSKGAVDQLSHVKIARAIFGDDAVNNILGREAPPQAAAPAPYVSPTFDQNSPWVAKPDSPWGNAVTTTGAPAPSGDTGAASTNKQAADTHIEAAKITKEAAGMILDAAKINKDAAGNLNRGNAPSPVKNH